LTKLVVQPQNEIVLNIQNMKNFLLLASLFVFAILSILLTNISEADSLFLSQAREINIAKVSIGGLKQGMSETQVINIIGFPKSRETYFSECNQVYYISLEYNKTLVTLYVDSKTSKGYLSTIKTTDPRYATNKGIKVGDSINKAEKAYSKKASPLEGKNTRYLAINDLSVACSLTFEADRKGKIKEINIDCFPC
jgi:outer membrane protein assembly factor BamE (lipoprotein component of BamABCDE complex)